MTTLGPYTVHPAADLFPLIDGDEFARLVEDVRTNGLLHPITLSADGTVLIDGRNRYRACEAANRDPLFDRIPSAFSETHILNRIVSENVRKRHLTAGQSAVIGAQMVPMFESAAKDRMLAGVQDPSADLHTRTGRAASQAAAAVGASTRGVGQALAVQRDAPDLLEEVSAGRMALDRADRERRQRMAALPQPEPVRKPSPVMLTLRTHTGQAVEYPQPQSRATFNETSGEGISWAAWSWNPVTGCLHGCRYCYARDLASSDRFAAGFPVKFEPLFHHERLDAPANTRIPAAKIDDPAYKRVFVCSMADLYGRWVPDEWIEKVHASCLANPQWEYLHLTKFPGRYVGLDFAPSSWVGTSVDEQKRVRLAEDAFRKIDGVKVKWLSLEPLLEPLEFTDLSMFDWVVIGAQTETRQPTGFVPGFAPPFDWVARIVAQAREAGCRVHLKPNLLGRTDGNRPGMQLPNEYPDGTDLP